MGKDPVMRLFATEQLLALLADAYHEAALRDADMRAATEALEAVRAAILEAGDFVALWRRLDHEVVRADPDRLRPTIAKLRDRVVESLKRLETDRLSEALQQDLDAGWAEWIRTYLRVVLEELPYSFCKVLADALPPFVEGRDPSMEKVRYYTKCALHERWAETLPWFLFLARQDGPPEQHARMLAMAAQIETSHLLRPARGRQLLEEADRLLVNDLWTLHSWSVYYLQQGDMESAKDYARRAIDGYPNSADGYLQLGDCFERAGELEAAEAQYLQATRYSEKLTTPYSRLMRLYGRREWFASRRSLLSELKAQIVAIDPDDEYPAFTTEGAIYQQNKLYAEAHRCHEQAMALDTTRLEAYVLDGYAFLEQSAEPQLESTVDTACLEGAERRFQEAIGVAPEAIDGYWGMVWLREQQQRSEEVLNWCTASLEHRPEWASIIRSRAGVARQRLGQLREAEAELMQALEADPENAQALETLVTVADDYYRQQDDVAAARRLYGEVRRRRGASWEATYQNRLGNIEYYRENYVAAAAAYRSAIAASPDNPVLHSNLALALEHPETSGTRLADLDEAIAELGRAAEIRPDEEYATRLEEVRHERRFVERYGEEAAAWWPLLEPVRVEIEETLGPTLLTEEQRLSREVLELIAALRERCRERYGLTLPGIRFSLIEDVNRPLPGEYRFQVFQQVEATGSVPTAAAFTPLSAGRLEALDIDGEPDWNGADGLWVDGDDRVKVEKSGVELWTIPEFLLRRLELVLEENLASFVGYQDTVNLLAGNSEPYFRIKNSPQLVAGLTDVLRRRLRMKVSIAPMATIAEEFLRHQKLDGGQPTIGAEQAADLRGLPAEIDLPESVSVTLIANDVTLVSKFWIDWIFQSSLQSTLFGTMGVLCPMLQVQGDADLAADAFQLQINHLRLPPVVGLSENTDADREKAVVQSSKQPEPRLHAALALLARNDPALRELAGALISVELVEHYLWLLKSAHPDLIKGVRGQFDTPVALSKVLRGRVAAGSSLRNLPTVLEEIIAASPPGAARSSPELEAGAGSG
jgi:tetratricopeptide (TPR) repeat protein